MSWSTRITSAPMCSGIRWITWPRCSVSSSGSPAPGSSSSTSCGLPTTARAISTSRRSRAPSVPTLTSGSTSSPTKLDRAEHVLAARGAVTRLGVLVRERHVAGDRELLDRLLGLERAPQAPARAAVVGHARAGRRRRRCTDPLGRLDEAAQHVEERRLARAVGTDQPAGARLEGQRHAVERRDAAEAHGQVADLDHDAVSLAGRPRPKRRRIRRPRFAMSRGNWYDEAGRRGEQHLQDADAEQDREQVRRQAPVVEQGGQQLEQRAGHDRAPEAVHPAHQHDRQQDDVLAGRELVGEQLADVAGQQPARDAGHERGERERPELVERDVHPGGQRGGLALADRGPGAPRLRRARARARAGTSPRPRSPCSGSRRGRSPRCSGGGPRGCRTSYSAWPRKPSPPLGKLVAVSTTVIAPASISVIRAR